MAFFDSLHISSSRTLHTSICSIPNSPDSFPCAASLPAISLTLYNRQVARALFKVQSSYALPHRGWQHKHTHKKAQAQTRIAQETKVFHRKAKAQTRIAQETKVFHSLVSAMATKGATHPTTASVQGGIAGSCLGNVSQGSYPSRP